MSELLQRFREAGRTGNPWRPLAFWGWNDRIDPEEVRRQVREMARGGLGGYIVHARRGLEAAYMGLEWMEGIRVAVDEGAKAGLAAWFCDENGGPSGACSGRVYGGREAFRAKSLVFEEVQPSAWQPSEATVAVFVARKERGGSYAAFRRVEDPRSLGRLAIKTDEAAVHFVYRSGEYVDVFSRKATEEFLRQTHERYAGVLGGEFGRAIPGIFTAESQYAGAGQRVPWSQELPKFFQRVCGYDLLERLPELFFPVGRYHKTRFDFYETALRLFLLAWTMPVYQWCDRHRLALAGHVMGASTLLGQMQWVGAAMPHYEYMHVPGVDHRGRKGGSAVAVKQASSVAAQFGRPRVLGKVFGGSGWDLGFDERRWLAERQMALGVNVVCQHLSATTLRGFRKRDDPPSLHAHQPWWPHAHLWNDYVSRVLAVLALGTAAADVLVIHPITSAWAEYSPLESGPVRELDERLRRLVEFLLGSHVDFHFGDELMLERRGRIGRGQLIVGACRYRAVVVPDATNLRRGTVRLLGRLKRAGGQVVFAGRIPGLVDGEPSNQPAALAKTCRRADAQTVGGRARLRRALAPRLEVRTSSGKEAAGVLAHGRRVGKEHVFFFLNTDVRRGVKVQIKLPASGVPIRLDPVTGEAWRLPARRSGARTVVGHEFGPRGSLLLALVPEAPKDVPTPVRVLLRRRQGLSGRWGVKRLGPNVLVLDTARWRTEGGAYSDPMTVTDIQGDLMRRGMQEAVVLRFEFACEIKGLKGRRFELVLEQPEACQLWYNGMRTPLVDVGPFWDGAFRRVDVTPYVRSGINVMELRRPWRVDGRRRALLMDRVSGWDARTVAPDTELEPVYLAGDFAVVFPGGSRGGSGGARWLKGRPRVVNEPAKVLGTDLVRAGYPFFAGQIALEKEVMVKGTPSPGAVLELAPPAAVTATVHINGVEAGTVWKAPWTVPVGGLLASGRNRIGILLTTSLRNLLGPHHREDSLGITPQSFWCVKGGIGHSAGPGGVPDAYQVVDFGLGDRVVLRY